MVFACCFGILHCTLKAVQFSESSSMSRGGPSLSAKKKKKVAYQKPWDRKTPLCSHGTYYLKERCADLFKKT